MKNGYGKEPFDLKLTVLRVLRNLPMLIVCTVIGTLVLGGAYYLKTIVFRPTITYEAVATLQAEYSDPDWVEHDLYLNAVTMKTWLFSKQFREPLMKHYEEVNTQGIALTDADLDQMLSSNMRSDLRIFETICTSENPKLAEDLSAALEITMVEDFPGMFHGVSSIEVMNPGVAKETEYDVRPVRAFELAGVLSVLFVFGFFLLGELGDDSIWLPTTLKTRYGLKVAGAMDDPMTGENLKYIYKDASKPCYVLPMTGEVDALEGCKLLKESLGKDEESVYALPATELLPEGLEEAKAAGGVLLLVPSGKHVGKRLEYELELLATREIPVLAAVLTEVDEKLLLFYYNLKR